MENQELLWKQVQTGEYERMESLSRLMLKAWGKRPGLEKYLSNTIVPGCRHCRHSVDVELLIKKEAGYWSNQKQFWLYHEPGQEILAEQLMAALRRIDNYTQSSYCRLGLRCKYLSQLEAEVVYQQTMSRR